MIGPLDGVRVLDVTHVLAGSYCSMLLADMGADVVKVERLGGDTSREGRVGDGFSPVNRNKRSIAIDLATSAGRDVARRLAATADVWVENFSPGAMDRLGLGYDDLAPLNPRLVYCSISGFGATGPYRLRRGFDLVAQGMSGIMSVTGEPGRAPVKAGVPIADLTAGMFAALGVLSAHAHSSRTGQGQFVDTSLLESALATLVWESGIYFETGAVPGPLGSAHRLSAPYQSFETADGRLNIGGANQASWERLLTALGRAELADDSRFAEPAARHAHRDELEVELSPVLRSATTEQWCERLEAAGVPCGPIYDLAQTWHDPHVVARNMMIEAPIGEITGRFIGPPVKLSATPWAVGRGVPAPGEHTEAVLSEAGFAAEQIAELLRAGVVAATSTHTPARGRARPPRPAPERHTS